MNTRIEYHHARNGNDPRGGMTTAMEVNEQGEVVAFAQAMCHEKDNFCKHTGRMKAAGRLKSKKLRVVPPFPLIKKILVTELEIEYLKRRFKRIGVDVIEVQMLQEVK